MSLINQALRKAQRDRTPNSMPQADEQSPAAYASTAASVMSPSLAIGLVIAVAVLIGLVAGLSVVIFKGGDASRVIASHQALSSTDSAPQSMPKPVAQTTLTPVEQNFPASLETEQERAKIEDPPRPSVVDELREARKAAEVQAAEEAALRAAAIPSEAIIAWLGIAKLSGVKLAGTESKVILNGKPYAVGESVNFKLGLKVMIIQEKRVLFIDNSGKKYMKRL